MGKKIANTAMIVLIINVLSRALALLANSMITANFGVNVNTSAYSFALTVTNIITTVIGTTLTTSVIPIYTDLKENHSRERSLNFLNNTISLTVIISLILIAAGYLLTPYIASISKDGDYYFGTFAIRVLLFSIVFISLYFVFGAILQANNKFYLVAMVSLPSSIVSILYIMFLSEKFGLYGLLFATLTGFFLQAAILIPALKTVQFKFRLSFNYKNEDILKIFKVVAPVIIGVCAYQINLLTNNSIAYSYDSERFIILNNAQNLGIQIVMTIVLAIASVIYPKLSELAAKGDSMKFNESLISAINSVILLLIPISFGYYIFSFEIMDLVYGYGKFTAENILLGGGIFAFYSFGILGAGFKEITDRAFYSLKNTKTSAYNGVFIMIINIGLSFVFVKLLGLAGIALAYSIASLFGGINILIRYKIKNRDFKYKPIIITILKSILSCIIMSIVILLLKTINFGDTKTALILKMGISALIGALVYLIILILLKTKEIANFTKRKV